MRNKRIVSLITTFIMVFSFFPNLGFGKGIKAEDNSKRYVINIVWDGISTGLFNRLKDSGMQTPNIDELISRGTKIDNLKTTIPSYGGAQAALLTGAFPETNGFLYRYFNKTSNKVLDNITSVKGQTIFEAINQQRPDMKTLTTGISVASISMNGRGVYKTSDANYDGKHTLIEYAKGDSLVSFNTVSGDIINAINNAPLDMPDYILAYSNDMKMLYWGGGDLSKYDQSSAAKIQELDTKLGEIINTLKNKGIYDNTIIILNSLSSIYAVPNKMSSTFATTISNESGVKTEYLTSNSAVSDPVNTKAVIVKTYIMKYAQLSFINGVSQDDKDKLLTYLNNKSTGFGKYIKQILNPSDFNAPSAFADYLLSPVDSYTFSAASAGYGRTDNLDDMNQFCIISGVGINKGAQLPSASMVDIAENVSGLLGINPPANNQGGAWNIFDFIKPNLNVSLDGQKDMNGDFNSIVTVTANASDDSGYVKVAYDTGSGYADYTGPFEINRDCTLKVKVYDMAGNTVEQAQNISFTKLFGSISINGDYDTINDITATNSESLTISGSILPGNSGTAVFINGEPVLVDGMTFQKVVPLNDGKNDIEILASINGISNVVSKTIYKVYNPRVTSVNDGALFSVPSLTVAGNSVPGSLVNINGQAVSLDKDGNFTADITLTEGENQIVVRSELGKYTNTTSLNVSYYKPAVIQITNLNNKQVVKTGSIIVEGTVDKPCVVTVNGNNPSLTVDNKFSARVDLQKGVNIINAVANFHGVFSTVSIKVVYVDPDDDYVVYINWDGFARYYYDLANQGGKNLTPVLNGLINKGVIFNNAYTGIPSITNAMQPAILSGAWPVTTGNAYRYYDKSSNTVIQFARENKAETIAEAAVRQGLTVASIHQFALENRGTAAGDPAKPYITAGEGADYSKRFDAAIRLIKGESVGEGTGEVELDEIPRFIALYMDDLDGLGHNEETTYGINTASTEAGRLQNVLSRLHEMDAKLGEFIQACKDRGIYDNMTFVLTTDHGMAPFGQQGDEPDKYGKSKLPDLVSTIEGLGYKTEVLFGGQTPKTDTDIVIVCVGLEAQLSFTKSYTQDDLDKIIETVKNKEYIGEIMDKDEMTERGAIDGFADLLISPKAPYSFKVVDDPDKVYVARGQHDSLDKHAQQIFSVMWGKGIKQGYSYNARIYNIDFARTMAELLKIDGPKDATGKILYKAFDSAPPKRKK